MKVMKKLIDGVILKKLNIIPDERGKLVEILRADDPFFEKFGQAYLTSAYPGVVKAWHFHQFQVDHFCVIRGMMKVVLFDNRKDSPTKDMVNEFFLGEQNPQLIRIPKGVFHGFKCIGECEALVINLPSEKYEHDNPDEYRVDPHDNDIPYDWSRKDG